MCALASVFGRGWPARAQAEDPVGVIELRYIPTARAQIAIWLERADGEFIQTLRLTEATAYRGIGNRPGASEMNSGYRWPYGRREGVLPIWANRRAAASSAERFPRVVFQQRQEGMASRTSSTGDQSVDDYYCLSFDRANSNRDALDAVSCASVFSSDKGRYLTEDDVAAGYAEPYIEPDTGEATMVPLPLRSLYPPRMDVTRCTEAGCFDHADVDRFAADARRVMPEIDAVTMATPQGGEPQSELVTIPAHWPAGRYVVWFEINVEGDYNDSFNASVYPTPNHPAGEWDYWATSFGYPYRGQPSVAFAVPFELGEPGVAKYATATPAGRSSWRVWSDDYGSLEDMAGMTSDPSGAPGSGADRLRLDGDGQRLRLEVEVLSELGKVPSSDPSGDDGMDPPTGDAGDSTSEPGTEPEPEDDPVGDGGGAPAGGEAEEDEPVLVPDEESGSGAVVIGEPEETGGGQVGPVRGLTLRRDDSIAHGHEWVHMSFMAPESALRLHHYEVKVATQPIVDEASFLREGRPAKRAGDGPEGATRLVLPVDVPAGERVEATLGALVANTDYHVAVRAVDRLNRSGPISVAKIRTPQRRFTTVTPCFVASVAYGTPLAREVGVLRRVRDRYLLPHGPGRALVQVYYRRGPAAADWLAEHPGLRRWTRWLLDGVVGLIR